MSLLYYGPPMTIAPGPAIPLQLGLRPSRFAHERVERASFEHRSTERNRHVSRTVPSPRGANGRHFYSSFRWLPNKSVKKFIFKAKLFMHGKNLDYHHPNNHYRVVAILASDPKGAASSSYHTRVTVEQRPVMTMAELRGDLTIEFVPPDQRFRVRAALKRCQQTGSIDDCVSRFQRLNIQVRGMSQADPIDRFCDGLKSATRKEVNYMRSSTLSEAVAHAQAFERTHSDRSGAESPRPRSHANGNQRAGLSSGH